MTKNNGNNHYTNAIVINKKICEWKSWGETRLDSPDASLIKTFIKDRRKNINYSERKQKLPP
jgi:hypothetical protein